MPLHLQRFQRLWCEHDTVVTCYHRLYFQNFADTHNISLMETSAKTSNNVEQLFATLASDLKHASENGHIKDDTPTITINAGSSHKKQGCFCS